MTDHRRNDFITQCRIEARRLLKQLRSVRPEDVAFAAGRFRQLRSFAAVSADDIPYLVEHVQLKHALALVAEARGYDSWSELITACERQPNPHVKPEAGTSEVPTTLELIVLSVKERAARCRIGNIGAVVTFRANRIWDLGCAGFRFYVRIGLPLISGY